MSYRSRVVGEATKHTHLYVFDVASKEIRPLTHGPFSIFTFDWAPDGKSIVFDRGPGSGLDALYRTDISTVRIADAEMQAFVVRNGFDHDPVISPDGQWIAFMTSSGVHDWLVEHEIHIMPANGGASRTVSQWYGRTPDAIFWGDDGALYVEGPFDTTTQCIASDSTGSGRI